MGCSCIDIDRDDLSLRVDLARAQVALVCNQVHERLKKNIDTAGRVAVVYGNLARSLREGLGECASCLNTEEHFRALAEATSMAGLASLHRSTGRVARSLTEVLERFEEFSGEHSALLDQSVGTDLRWAHGWYQLAMSVFNLVWEARVSQLRDDINAQADEYKEEAAVWDSAVGDGLSDND